MALLRGPAGSAELPEGAGVREGAELPEGAEVREGAELPVDALAVAWQGPSPQADLQAACEGSALASMTRPEGRARAWPARSAPWGVCSVMKLNF